MKQFYFILLISIISSSTFSQQTIWGMTGGGGTNNIGTIFSLTPGSNTLTSQFSFPYSTPGNNPQGCMQASNGKVYGLTYSGGSKYLGSLYEYDLISLQYTVLYSFTQANGINPTGNLMQASNGKLYGMTPTGGAFNYGVLFEFDLITGVYTVKKHFTNNALMGGVAYGGLIEASVGKLYGLTAGGGNASNGTLFEYDFNLDVLTKKCDFNIGVSGNGAQPRGSLLKAANGNLYGMTLYGGANGKGTLFEYIISSNTLTRKVNFSNTLGGSPNGTLIEASNGNIYGLATTGGANNFGVLFEYNYTSNVYTVKRSFANSNDGIPTGSLFEASNGSLYGITGNTGYVDWGKIFEYNLATSTFTDRFHFTNTTGIYPSSNLLIANNGKLYGTATTGGSNSANYYGTFFEFDIASNVFQKHFDFNDKLYGSNPSFKLTQANNGKLYGTTRTGGINNFGTLFEYDPITLVWTKKFDFTQASGKWPQGSLVLANNGKLYGMGNQGGTVNHGTIFEFNPTTGVVTTKINFNGSSYATGVSPQGSLMQTSTGKIYGLSLGGSMGAGVLFEYDYMTNIYTKKLDLIAANGSTPYGDLIEAANGKLYTMTTIGGVNDLGAIFEYDAATNVITKKADFDGVGNGQGPEGSLVQAANGNLYGLTKAGGVSGSGVLFEYNISTNTMTKKVDLNGTTTGGYPLGTMLQSANGKLYGTTQFGGVKGSGILFEYDYNTNSYTKQLDLDSTNGSFGLDLLELCLLPANTGAISGSNHLCIGAANNTTLSVSASSNATTYNWNLPLGTTITTGNGTNSIISDFSSLSAGIYTLSANGINGCGAGSLSSFSITIGPIFNLNTTNTICIGTSINLIGNSANTYTWSTGQTTSSISINPITTTIYTVTGTDFNNCTNSQTVSVTVDNTCADVWPGDANSDGSADNLDVLELGLHFTQTGAPRTSTNNSWQSYFANNWIGAITNGKNLNHSDCNGDGIINDDDTLAIYNNYGLTHAFKPAQTNTVPSITIVPDQSMVTKGTWGTASVYLGDATNSINNINGIAYTIDFDNTLIEPNSIYVEYQNSFIDASQNLYFRKLDFSSGKLFTASTHTISNNVSGFGKIAALHYQIKSSLATDQVLTIGLSQANQSNASGVISPLTSGTGTLMAVGTSVGIKESLMSGDFLISPNPTNGLLNISFGAIPSNTKIELYNSIGALVLTEAITNKNNTVNVSDLSSGMYFMKVLEGDKVIAVQKVVKE